MQGKKNAEINTSECRGTNARVQDRGIANGKCGSVERREEGYNNKADRKGDEGCQGERKSKPENVRADKYSRAHDKERSKEGKRSVVRRKECQ